jgi:hypothetical protein
MPTVSLLDNTNALIENASELSNDEDAQSGAERRLVKWRLQRTAQALLPNERVAFCMRRLQATTVDVLYSPPLLGE